MNTIEAGRFEDTNKMFEPENPTADILTHRCGFIDFTRSKRQDTGRKRKNEEKFKEYNFR